ncbi:MAG: type II toxin-antitoxin system HicB family antitoxin [Selenomonas sp.]|nr:type II toxin-antitoxin system HicB family antitoxin [Selenomonas sp.]
MQYVYPAIFYNAIEGGYCVEFPDVDGAATQGETLYEAMEMAEDALAGILVCYEDYKAGRSKLPMNNRIVAPTPIENIKAEPDEYSTGAFVTLIKVDTDKYRKLLESMQAEAAAV